MLCPTAARIIGAADRVPAPLQPAENGFVLGDSRAQERRWFAASPWKVAPGVAEVVRDYHHPALSVFAVHGASPSHSCGVEASGRYRPRSGGLVRTAVVLGRESKANAAASAPRRVIRGFSPGRSDTVCALTHPRWKMWASNLPLVSPVPSVSACAGRAPPCPGSTGRCGPGTRRPWRRGEGPGAVRSSRTAVRSATSSTVLMGVALEDGNRPRIRRRRARGTCRGRVSDPWSRPPASGSAEPRAPALRR